MNRNDLINKISKLEAKRLNLSVEFVRTSIARLPYKKLRQFYAYGIKYGAWGKEGLNEDVNYESKLPSL